MNNIRGTESWVPCMPVGAQTLLIGACGVVPDVSKTLLNLLVLLSSRDIDWQRVWSPNAVLRSLLQHQVGIAASIGC